MCGKMFLNVFKLTFYQPRCGDTLFLRLNYKAPSIYLDFPLWVFTLYTHLTEKCPVLAFAPPWLKSWGFSSLIRGKNFTLPFKRNLTVDPCWWERGLLYRWMSANKRRSEWQNLKTTILQPTKITDPGKDQKVPRRFHEICCCTTRYSPGTKASPTECQANCRRKTYLQWRAVTPWPSDQYLTMECPDVTRPWWEA